MDQNNQQGCPPEWAQPPAGAGSAQQTGYGQQGGAQGWQQGRAEYPSQAYYQQQGSYDPNACQQGPAPVPTAEERKLVAGLLAMLLGGLGIHKFYLGRKKAGIIMLAVSLGGFIVTLGFSFWAMEVIGFIEGVMYLTKSDQEFYQTYVAGDRSWF